MGRWGGWGHVRCSFCLPRPCTWACSLLLAAIVTATLVCHSRDRGAMDGHRAHARQLRIRLAGLGNAGIDMGLPMRLAPWIGVYGLSFLFAMMAAATALVIL